MDMSKEEDRRENKEREKQSDSFKEVPKGKSCRGFLYYSSSLRSHNRNPRCIGIPRPLHQVPNYADGHAEVESSKEGRTLIDFYYACAGYSVYTNLNNVSTDQQGRKTDLPFCVGLELLADRKATDADTAPNGAPASGHVPAHAHAYDREYAHEFPRPQGRNGPGNSTGDDFFTRFTRNAYVVASGVPKHLRRLGNHLKSTFEDIFFPYRKRPK